MQKSTRVQPQHSVFEQKSKIPSNEDKKPDPHTKTSKISTKNEATKKDPVLILKENSTIYEKNFSQDSQNMELLEKRVDFIIQDAITIENEFGKSEEEEEIHFEERLQAITMKIQQIFETFSSKQEQLEGWLRETLSNHLQNTLENINGFNQSLENNIRERKELQNNTTQALGLAVSVQKYLKENQKLWNLN